MNLHKLGPLSRFVLNQINSYIAGKSVLFQVTFKAEDEGGHFKSCLDCKSGSER